MTEKPEHIGLDNKNPTTRDRIDLAHEVSGESTGRIQRFLSEDRIDIYGQSEKKKSEQHNKSMLYILLTQDAQYAALYQHVSEQLDNAYTTVDKALEQLDKELADSTEKLKSMEDNAATLEDGTKVFLSSDDGLYSKNGQRLYDTVLQTTNIPENAPSWEAYKAELERREILLEHKQETEIYKRDVLDTAKERMSNEDDPPSMEELRDLENKIKTQMPEFVSNISTEFAAPISSAAQDIQGKPNLSVPDLTVSFEKVRHDIPDLSGLPTEHTPSSAPAP